MSGTDIANAVQSDHLYHPHHPLHPPPPLLPPPPPLPLPASSSSWSLLLGSLPPLPRSSIANHPARTHIGCCATPALCGVRYRPRLSCYALATKRPVRAQAMLLPGTSSSLLGIDTMSTRAVYPEVLPAYARATKCPGGSYAMSGGACYELRCLIRA
eukprot:2303082-Rhodomonas_salina.1